MAINNKIQIVTSAGRRKLLNSVSGVTPFPSSYGSSFETFFKPFTTNIGQVGVPHYIRPINEVLTSGFMGANASGLNPYGYHTYNEGILSGNTAQQDMDNVLDPWSVRSHGLKTPFTMVGWGYDIFGYPAPNAASGWTRNGSGVAPSSYFLAVASGGNPLFADHGSKVFYSEYLAAPLDVRYDNNRKVWTAPQSIYSAHVIRTLLSDVTYTGGSTPQFIENLKYDVQIFDGIANKRTFTGLTPISPRPAASSFKVIPLNSGDFCLLVHTLISGIPGFGVYTNEQPGSEECLTSSSGSAAALSSFSSLAVGTGVVKYDVLLTSPLASKYGGVGHASYNSRQTLMSDTSGTLKRYTLQYGSGIEFLYSDASATTGSITIKIASGVVFTHNGVNTTISEMQGLTTPLNLAQGGTGSSGKNFVDLTTTQNVSGIKQFISQIQSTYVSSSGYISAYGFSTDNYAGLGYLSGTGLSIISTGQPMISFNTGIWIRQPTLCHLNNSPLPALVVKQNNIYGDNTRTYIQEWQNNSGTIVGAVNSGGYFQSRGFILATGNTTGVTFLVKGSGMVNNTVVAPTGNGRLLLDIQVTGYTGTIPGGSGLIVVNGLIQGYV